MQDNVQHTLTTYVSDMLAAVREAVEPLTAQAKDDDVQGLPEVASLLPKIESTLRGQTETLERRLEALGGHEAAGLKRAVAAVLGSAAGVFDKTRKTRISKYLRDDLTALSLLTVSYTMLHTTASALGDEETATLSERNLKELTPLVMQISHAVPAVVIHELKLEEFPVDEAAIRATQQASAAAWS